MIEAGIELGVLALAAAAAARVLLMPAARLELRAHPILLAGLCVAAAAFGAVTAWAAAESVVALRALTVVVAAVWCALAWRASPRYGRRRGLPPGSLGLRSSLAALRDRSFLQRQGSRHGPVFKTAQFHQPVVCVVGLDRGRDLLRRSADALEPPPLPLSSVVPRGFLRYMTPEDHETYSRLFRTAFSPAVVAATEPQARDAAKLALRALAAQNGDGAEPRAVVLRYVEDSTQRLFFGDLFDEDDRRRIRDWSADAEFGDAIGSPSDRATCALRQFGELLAARAVACPSAGEGAVWGELVRVRPESAADPTVAGNLFLLLQASRESITGLILWALALLSGAPKTVSRLRAEPGSEATQRVIDETLRLAQSEYVYRRAVRPVELDGFRIPTDWMIRVCVAESHRLDPPFERPATFDPDRFENCRYSASEFSPFGLDRHACLGSRMSVLQARAFLEELVGAYDWEVVEDGPPERGNRHWHHWEPSSDFRVALIPRGAARSDEAAIAADRSSPR